MEAALEKIKDGGVAPDVNANVVDRMLEMCRLSAEALSDSKDEVKP